MGDIKLGDIGIKKIKAGAQIVLKVRLGTTLIWEAFSGAVVYAIGFESYTIGDFTHGSLNGAHSKTGYYALLLNGTSYSQVTKTFVGKVNISVWHYLVGDGVKDVDGTIKVDGTTFVTIDSAIVDVWTKYSFTFTGTGTHTIALHGCDYTQEAKNYWDDFSIEYVLSDVPYSEGFEDGTRGDFSAGDIDTNAKTGTYSLSTYSTTATAVTKTFTGEVTISVWHYQNGQKEMDGKIKVDGVTFVTIDSGITSTWTHYSFAFTGSGEHTVSLHGCDFMMGADNYWDDFSIDYV